MFYEELDRLAEHEWEWSRARLLVRGQLGVKATMVPADEDGPTKLITFDDLEPPPMSPYDVMRGLLERYQVQAFVMVTEAWHVEVPFDIAKHGFDAVSAWRRMMLPHDLEDLPADLRGESLVLVALSRDYTLHRSVMFKRNHRHQVVFAPEDRKPDDLRCRFLELRSLLVAPQRELH